MSEPGKNIHQIMKKGYDMCSEYKLTDALSDSYIKDVTDYLKYNLGNETYPKLVFFSMICTKQYILQDTPPFDKASFNSLVVAVGELTAFIYLAGATVYKIQELVEPLYPVPQ